MRRAERETARNLLSILHTIRDGSLGLEARAAMLRRQGGEARRLDAAADHLGHRVQDLRRAQTAATFDEAEARLRVVDRLAANERERRDAAGEARGRELVREVGRREIVEGAARRRRTLQGRTR